MAKPNTSPKGTDHARLVKLASSAKTPPEVFARLSYSKKPSIWVYRQFKRSFANDYLLLAYLLATPVALGPNNLLSDKYIVISHIA